MKEIRKRHKSRLKEGCLIPFNVLWFVATLELIQLSPIACYWRISKHVGGFKRLMQHVAGGWVCQSSCLPNVLGCDFWLSTPPWLATKHTHQLDDQNQVNIDDFIKLYYGASVIFMEPFITVFCSIKFYFHFFVWLLFQIKRRHSYLLRKIKNSQGLTGF